MKLRILNANAAPARTELLVLLACEPGQGERPQLPKGVKLPEQALDDFRGENRELRQADALAGPAKRVLLVGLGKLAELDVERLRRAAALAVKRAEALRFKSIVLQLSTAVLKAAGEERAGRAVAEGALMGAYSFVRLKSKAQSKHLEQLTLLGGGEAFARGAEHGQLLAEANLFARDLQNLPGNLLTPRDLASAAQKLAKRSARLRCRIFDEQALTRLGMGSLLSVAKGSAEPARFIHLTYKPKGKSRGTIALVGKGLTFDAGGISLKPAAKMDEMKFDMSGGAAVLGVFHALAKLDFPFVIHGLVPTSENLPDGKANKPGDVVTAMSGTTIEILNTDAEGRLILCDALTYAVQKLEPDTIIDLATLTGAVVVALGHELSGLFASTDKLREELLAAGKECGEPLWPLPLLDAHREQMKSSVADLRNINDPGHGNGSSAGAAFLSYFVGNVEWAHLDIAGTAYGGLNRDYIGGSGANAVGVRLLLQYLENRR